MTPKKAVLHTTPKRSILPLLNASPSASSPTKKSLSSTKDYKKFAFVRFDHLVKEDKPSLQLPLKYRQLADLFRSVDIVAATLNNRSEQITFKKLKMAVQRMTKKNFTESHLAQILTVFPGAFNVVTEKTRNFGSESKHETYQYVITPSYGKIASSTKSDSTEDACNKNMNSQLLTARYKQFCSALLEKALKEHDTFLKFGINPPIDVGSKKVTRWHPDFDLGKCPDIEPATLPELPQNKGFANAQEVLSTAKNLFVRTQPTVQSPRKIADNTKPIPAPPSGTETSNLLKGIPKALLEKIKQKQAAKALNYITEKPSTNPARDYHKRHPDLLRHIRNVYITERKGILPFDTVVTKIQHSYAPDLNATDLDTYLRFVAKQLPHFLSFEVLRKTIFVRLNRDESLAKISSQLNF